MQSGTITAKIRGSGVVESSDPYNVEVKESRKVAEVAVKVGDTSSPYRKISRLGTMYMVATAKARPISPALILLKNTR